MQRTQVSSSNLRSVGYDPETSTLEIEFMHGGVYSYSDVPEAEYNGLMSASSHGSYFNANIRKGGYPYRKIR
ncbi:MAG: KTSC domain-containing protein [Candidatus Electrothrix sp. YB6]